MEATVSRPRRAFGQRKDQRKLPVPRISHRSENLRSYDRAETVDVQADLRQENLWLGFSSSQVIFYTLLLLKIVLWIILVWILSGLHMGLPCFLLALTYWLYKGPLQRALDWAKRHLKQGRGSSRAQ